MSCNADGELVKILKRKEYFVVACFDLLMIMDVMCC